MINQTPKGYNHMDPADRQRPLPVEPCDLGDPPVILGLSAARAVLPTAGGAPVRIALWTDSAHLALFFCRNWPVDPSDAHVDARILALRKPPEQYGLPSWMAPARWYCPRTRQVWTAGNEYYGNLKITVRGLCSDLAPDDEMFLHGTALRVAGRGLVLCGMSGAGKTTLTREILSLCGDDALVVNDDWGPVSLARGLLATTGEPHLHMKYPSVRTLAPDLAVSPETHLSENYQGDSSDPRARLLVRPGEVFGECRAAQSAEIDLVAVILRGDTSRASLRRLGPGDIGLIEEGQRSTFYERTEYFLNGSLFLTDKSRRRRARDQHLRLLQRFPCALLTNAGPPAEGAHLLLKALHDSRRLV